MNTLKLITISTSVIIAFGILFLLIYFFLKPFKVIKNDDDNLKISYGIWFSSLFISGSSTIYFMMKSLFDALNVVNRINQEKSFEVLKIGGGLLLISFGWFTLWYFIINMLSKLFFKSRESQQMDSDNWSYFLIKGCMLISSIFSLSLILEILLKTVIPEIEVPFYH